MCAVRQMPIKITVVRRTLGMSDLQLQSENSKALTPKCQPSTTALFTSVIVLARLILLWISPSTWPTFAAITRRFASRINFSTCALWVTDTASNFVADNGGYSQNGRKLGGFPYREGLRGNFSSQRSLPHLAKHFSLGFLFLLRAKKPHTNENLSGLTLPSRHNADFCFHRAKISDKGL